MPVSSADFTKVSMKTVTAACIISNAFFIVTRTMHLFFVCCRLYLNDDNYFIAFYLMISLIITYHTYIRSCIPFPF